MANIGTNKGRRLRLALSRFAAILIDEARDLSGLSFARLDEEFGFCEGQCQRYALYPQRQKTRAPQANEIQNLENLVARLLRRPAHVVVVEVHNERLSGQIGPPDSGMNLRDFDAIDIQLGYEGGWPTYRRLKYSLPHFGVRLFDLYAWQYGILWERGVLPAPWTREELGIPEWVPVESFLPDMVDFAKSEQMASLVVMPE